MNSNRNILIAALACLVVVLAVLLVRSREPSPPAIAPGPTATASVDDREPAASSTEPFFTNFIASFKSSSIASCRKALAAKLGTQDTAALTHIDDVCACAAERTAGTITQGEARASSVSALSGDTATNPTMKAIADRFAEAGRTCMAEKPGLPAPDGAPNADR